MLRREAHGKWQSFARSWCSLALAGVMVLILVSLGSATAQGLAWPTVVSSAKPAVVWVLAKTTDGISSGSGVIVSSDGLILTANHVIDGATEVTVVLEESRKYQAMVVRTDTASDVAILRISASGLRWLVLGNSDSLNYEEEVRVLGYPLPGHGVGYVAVAGRIQGFRVRDGVRLFQHDAPTEAGLSGGPVVNARMEVVGIHLGFIKGDHSAYTLAVAVNSIKGLLPSLATGPTSTPPAPSPPSSQKVRVVLDQTRNVGVGPRSYFSTRVTEWYGTTELVKHLTGLGYTVDTLDKWPITEEQLARASVLIIFGPEFGFRKEEIEVLQQFVANGGGLYIGFQRNRLDPGSSWGTGPIARAFGGDFRLGGNVADSSQNFRGRVWCPMITDFAPHPITEGVTGWYVQGAVIVPPPGAVVLARSSPNSWFDRAVASDYWGNDRRDRDMYGVLEEAGPFPLLAALEYGKGRVVLSGDSSFMMNDWIGQLSAKRLAGNIVDWLARKR